MFVNIGENDKWIDTDAVQAITPQALPGQMRVLLSGGGEIFITRKEADYLIQRKRGYYPKGEDR